MNDRKYIKDPVHGYIALPQEYCRLFVDTPIFQRLRNIEQTSMRWLFPAARHDRFIHSLGVYHIADKFYAAIKENVADKEVLGILEETGLRNTFRVAALMHDCGHAPFSHTFEEFYNRNTRGKEHDSAFKALKKVVPRSDAQELDFTRIGAKPPAPHEAMSAYVLLKFYEDAMRETGVDSGLAARMITGAAYLKPRSLKEKVSNVFISLVNGSALDVDKLDYIIRDTWASGVKNTAIDVDRLIRGATISRYKDANGGDVVKFAFVKSAVSVVQSVIDARNYLYDWIYGHHTVLYYSHLLKNAVLRCVASCAKREKKNADSVLKGMFSPAMFSWPDASMSDKGDVSPYLLTDGDLMYLLKRHASEDVDYQAYVSHKPRHIPLWKTAAEYCKYIDKGHRYSIDSQPCIEAIRKRFKLSADECFACDDMTKKIYDLKDDAVMIEMSAGEVMPITEVAHLPLHPHLTSGQKSSLFYVFIDKEKIGLKNEIIKFLNAMEVKRIDYCRCRHVAVGTVCKVHDANMACTAHKL